MNLDGRSAIVTGGAGGLGSATVRRLVDAGMHVAIFDRDLDRTQDLAKELKAPAPKAADKVQDSTTNMEAAKKNLEKNEAKPGATVAHFNNDTDLPRFRKEDMRSDKAKEIDHGIE